MSLSTPASSRILKKLRLSVAAAVVGILATSAASADEKQSLEELRNTVINLLQALVAKGVMTREQA